MDCGRGPNDIFSQGLTHRHHNPLANRKWVLMRVRDVNKGATKSQPDEKMAVKPTDEAHLLNSRFTRWPGDDKLQGFR